MKRPSSLTKSRHNGRTRPRLEQVVPANTSLIELDQLIVDVGGAGDAGKQSRGPHSLLLEHLRAARSSLLGSMSGEYRSSLQDAKESAGSISPKNVRSDIRKRLQTLMG